VLNSSESTLLINELLFDYKRKDIKWIFKGRVINKLLLFL